jgi:hypothetical protein
MTWNGSTWSFTPSGSNPWSRAPPSRGRRIARRVQVPASMGSRTLLQSHGYRRRPLQYQYALYNFDSDRMVSRFAVPQDVTSAEHGFRDPD